MTYKEGTRLTLRELILLIEARQTVMWHGKAKNAAFLVNCQLGTLMRGIEAGAFSEALRVEEKKKE